MMGGWERESDREGPIRMVKSEQWIIVGQGILCDAALNL